MLRNLSLGGLLLGSLMLAGCGSEAPDIAPPIVSGQQATVTLSVAFSDSNRATAQGMPNTASKAVISIYDGTTLLGTKEIIRSAANPSASVAVQLPVGKTYRLEASVLDGTSTPKEVAWGRLSYTVNGDSDIVLPVRSIVSGLSLLFSRATAEGREYLLNVQGPNGEIPFNDFDVTYASNGGSVISQSKVGVVTSSVGEQQNLLTAQVQALDSNHQLQTFKTSRIAASGTLTFTGKIDNFPFGYTSPLKISATTIGGKKASGTIQTNGTYSIVFPDVTDELKTIVGYPESNTLFTELGQLNIIDNRDVIIGSFRVKNVNFSPSDPKGRPRDFATKSIIFADQKTSSVPLSNPGYSYFGVEMGWNVTWYPGYSTLFSAGLDKVPLIADFVGFNGSITQTSDTTSPIEGNDVQHTVKVTGKPGQNFTISVPSSLSLKDGLSSFIGASCVTSTTMADSSLYKCTVPGDMTSNYPISISVTFKTTTQLLSTYARNPTDLVATLLPGNYIDSDPADDVSILSIRRIPKGGSGGGSNLIFDFEPPVISLAALPELTAGRTVTLTGAVSDNRAVVSVEAFDGVVPLGNATLLGNPVQGWQLTWKPKVSGSSMLRLVASDSAGNMTRLDTPITVK